MKGDVHVKLSVRIVGNPEPIIAMDGESDQGQALIDIARTALATAERKLASLQGDKT